MWIFDIRNDQFNKIGETDRLGYPYGTVIPMDLTMDDEFPFTRCCFSIGDWGIISALPELLKTKYPNLKISLPSKQWLNLRVGQGTWAYENSEVSNNFDLIFANNPYIDYRFNIGDHEVIHSDHSRIYRYDSEPLVEQILRFWGFTEEELIKYDTRPKLYFSKEEQEIGDSIIKQYIGSEDFGCSIFAARLEKYNHMWEGIGEKKIRTVAQEQYKDYPVFYYNSFDFPNERWNTVFKEWISFKNIPSATIRIQMYIKCKALFNLGYQSGLGDACTGLSVHHILTPYESLPETVIRGENIIYYFPNGNVSSFKINHI
jgi:hypothetical protein